MKVRSPAVANSFYPSNPTELSQLIDEYLEQATPVGSDGDLCVLLVPHAGYRYSGSVAAEGYKQIEGKSYEKVFLLGTSHHATFNYAAVDRSNAWKTPLGKVLLDNELIEGLVTSTNIITVNESVHKSEHSLEVQVPFLQKCLDNKEKKPSFKIIPILLGSISQDREEEISKVLTSHIDEKTLLVVSSDLSHYPSYEDAQEIDRKTTSAILTGDPHKFSQTIRKLSSKQIPNLATCACGESAIRVGMRVAENIGATDIRLLKYLNSGDITSSRDRVVGYAAVGFFAEGESNTTEFSSNQKKKLLKMARRTLETEVAENRNFEADVKDPALEKELGAFITLKKDGQLRGCMGVFNPEKPLWKVVQEQTTAAAKKDPRFPPVQLEEISDIEIEISVLSPPQKISDPNQIELGKDGVMVKRGNKGGTFLPQVAIETGWDLETFLCQLCTRKAGLYKDAWKDLETEIYTYNAEVFSESDFNL